MTIQCATLTCHISVIKDIKYQFFCQFIEDDHLSKWMFILSKSSSCIIVQGEQCTSYNIKQTMLKSCGGLRTETSNFSLNRYHFEPVVLMDDLQFTTFSTVFQSYQGDGRMIKKSRVQYKL